MVLKEYTLVQKDQAEEVRAALCRCCSTKCHVTLVSPYGSRYPFRLERADAQSPRPCLGGTYHAANSLKRSSARASRPFSEPVGASYRCASLFVAVFLAAALFILRAVRLAM